MANPHAPVMGRFRTASTRNSHPAALNRWRLTTDSPTVAAAVHDLLGGDAPQAAPLGAPEAYEVNTAASDISVLIHHGAFSQHYLRRADPDYRSTGRSLILPSGDRVIDPDRDLSRAERRARAAATGERLVTSAYVTLAADPGLGVFLFRSASWDLAERWSRAGIRSTLLDAGSTLPAILRVTSTVTGPHGLPQTAAHLLFDL